MWPLSFRAFASLWPKSLLISAIRDSFSFWSFEHSVFDIVSNSCPPLFGRIVLRISDLSFLRGSSFVHRPSFYACLLHPALIPIINEICVNLRKSVKSVVKNSLDTQPRMMYNIHLTNRGFLIWRTKPRLKRPSRRGRDSATLHFARACIPIPWD